MLKEQMNKLKNIFKSEGGNDKKKIENLIVFVIILIITIIVINMILKEDKVIDNTQVNNTKILANNKEEKQILNEENTLKQDLEEILSEIEGVGKVKVLITYSQTSQTVALYNEDNAQSDTEEKDSRRRK